MCSSSRTSMMRAYILAWNFGNRFQISRVLRASPIDSDFNLSLGGWLIDPNGLPTFRPHVNHIQVRFKFSLPLKSSDVSHSVLVFSHPIVGYVLNVGGESIVPSTALTRLKLIHKDDFALPWIVCHGRLGAWARFCFRLLLRLDGHRSCVLSTNSYLKFN